MNNDKSLELGQRIRILALVESVMAVILLLAGLFLLDNDQDRWVVMGFSLLALFGADTFAATRQRPSGRCFYCGHRSRYWYSAI